MYEKTRINSLNLHLCNSEFWSVQEFLRDLLCDDVIKETGPMLGFTETRSDARADQQNSSIPLDDSGSPPQVVFLTLIAHLSTFQSNRGDTLLADKSDLVNLYSYMCGMHSDRRTSMHNSHL